MEVNIILFLPIFLVNFYQYFPVNVSFNHSNKYGYTVSKI